MNDAAPRPRFYVKIDQPAILVVMSAEVIPHSLFIDRQVLRDARDTAGGQSMLDAAEFIESNVHNPFYLVNNIV